MTEFKRFKIEAGRIYYYHEPEEPKAWMDKDGNLYAVPSPKNTTLRDENGDIRTEWDQY